MCAVNSIMTGPLPAILILIMKAQILFGHDQKNESIKSFFIESDFFSELGEENRQDLVSKVGAPLMVIGSLIVGLLLALLIYRRKSRRGYPHSYSILIGY